MNIRRPSRLRINAYENTIIYKNALLKITIIKKIIIYY